MKIAIVLGTRPEIVKMSPIIRELEYRKMDYFIIHTNQHYSYEMDKIFFEELELPEPKYNLNVGSGIQGEQTAKALIRLEEVLIKENPSFVLVQGDTNSVLAGALAASKLHIKVGHIEAGLRSYDWNMPEEINRIITDHISSILFPPTKLSESILLQEGIKEEKIVITGNTIVDAVLHNLSLIKKRSSILKKLELEREKYILVTSHRAENVDIKENIKGILEGIEKVADKLKIKIIFPIHPRTKKRLEEFNLKYEKITFIEPVGFLEFLELENNAKMIMTDSGGIQEEACILHIPCITLRENTERPETIKSGGNVLVGHNPLKILNVAREILNKKIEWNNPLGNGEAASIIIETLIKNYSQSFKNNLEAE